MANILDQEIIIKYGTKLDGTRGWVASCRCYTTDNTTSPQSRGEDIHTVDLSSIQTWLDNMLDNNRTIHNAT